MVQGVGDRGDQGGCLRRGGAVGFYPGREITAFDELGDDVPGPIRVPPDVVNRNDVGVVEAGHDLGLVQVGFQFL